MPGLVERLLGFLDIGKDFVTAETIVQVKDLARKYPDIAEVCVGSISNISLEVSLALHIHNICMVASALCHSCLTSRQLLFLSTELLSAGTFEATILGQTGISTLQLQCPWSKLCRQRHGVAWPPCLLSALPRIYHKAVSVCKTSLLCAPPIFTVNV